MDELEKLLVFKKKYCLKGESATIKIVTCREKLNKQEENGV